MKIKKNGKVINLTESDLRRIVKKVIKEQESDTTPVGDELSASSKIAPILKDYVDNPSKGVSVEFLFKSDKDVDEKSRPKLAGNVKYNNEKAAAYWLPAMTKYQNKKDMNSLKTLVDYVKNNKVTLRPFNVNGDSYLKYQWLNDKQFKIVKS